MSPTIIAVLVRDDPGRRYMEFSLQSLEKGILIQGLEVYGYTSHQTNKPSSTTFSRGACSIVEVLTDAHIDVN
jgi:hypothetical protein